MYIVEVDILISYQNKYREPFHKIKMSFYLQQQWQSVATRDIFEEVFAIKYMYSTIMQTLRSQDLI